MTRLRDELIIPPADKSEVEETRSQMAALVIALAGGALFYVALAVAVWWLT